MMRLRFLSILLSLVFISCGRQEKEVRFDDMIIAVRSDTSVVVDGKLDDPVWQESDKIYLRDSDNGNNVSDSSFSTYAMTAYNDNYLYIAFLCNDSDIYSYFTERDQHLWEDEAVEVFIDTDDHPNTYVEIECSPNNVLFDSYIVDPVNIDVEETSKFDLPGIKTASTVDGTVNIRDDIDKRWTVEMAIPIDEIVEDFNKKTLKSAKWKINFYRIDRDADGPVYYAWSPTHGRFHKPKVFGKLIFR